MDQTASNSCRASRGVSTALIVGLLIGVTVAALRPAVASATRDGTAQRLATRQLAQSLARAVRELAGSERDKPAITWVRAVRPGETACAVMGSKAGSSVHASLLREALISLPPPLA